uniref:Uncharacterized protein n=1 Tax=Anopheles atroparvus TaxID=41427 RepID=A0A182IWB9_ANOAO
MYFGTAGPGATTVACITRLSLDGVQMNCLSREQQQKNTRLDNPRESIDVDRDPYASTVVCTMSVEPRPAQTDPYASMRRRNDRTGGKQPAQEENGDRKAGQDHKLSSLGLHNATLGYSSVSTRLSTDISEKPSMTATSCTDPKLLAICCRLLRSFGSTSLTVTYSSVPPARPCSAGMMRSVSVSFNPSSPIPMPMPATEPRENVSTCRMCEQRCRVPYAHSCTPSAKPTTNLCALTAPSSNRTLGPEFCTPIASPSSRECMLRASSNPNTPARCASIAAVWGPERLLEDDRDRLHCSPSSTFSDNRCVRCVSESEFLKMENNATSAGASDTIGIRFRVTETTPTHCDHLFVLAVIVCPNATEQHQLVDGVHEEEPDAEHNLSVLVQ